METIVFYNKGRDAARRGETRAVPDTIEYPVVSKYVPYHTITAQVKGVWHLEREWLKGFDSVN